MNFLSSDAHARRPLHKMDGVFFFSVLLVSCWNIRFGALSNFRPTIFYQFSGKFDKSSSLISATLNIRDDFLASI